TPLALDENAIDLAAITVFVNASSVLMSGFGAPDRTAMPMLERTRSRRLPGTTLPSAISPSSPDAARITTSIGSPRRSRLGIASGELPIDGPNAVTTLWPVARSKCGTSSRYSAVKAPEVTTLISSAVAAAATSRPARTRTARRRGARIMPGDSARPYHEPEGGLTWKSGDVRPHLVERLAGRHVQRPHVWTAERVVGDEVFGNRDELEELALRRDHIDAGFGVERFRGSSQLVHPGGRIQVALRVDAHAVS